MRIDVAKAMPVIYVKNDGGGYNEFQAPEHSMGEYLVNANIPHGATILATWYVPFEGIGDLENFYHINVEQIHGNNRQIKLYCKAYDKPRGRIRLMIHTLYQLP